MVEKILFHCIHIKKRYRTLWSPVVVNGHDPCHRFFHDIEKRAAFEDSFASPFH